MDEDGYNQEDVLCPSCNKQSDPATMCLPIKNMIRIPVKQGRKKVVMSVMMINAAVAVGRMHPNKDINK